MLQILEFTTLSFLYKETFISFTLINLLKKIEKSYVEFSQSRSMLIFLLVRRHVGIEDRLTNARRLPCSHIP